ncbi:MAG TPA: substrate-binding domain-containing protein [Anaerolineales bacterium]|nr:substrate-binding domain-containing protein [Anaerolineales bacterium]
MRLPMALACTVLVVMSACIPGAVQTLSPLRVAATSAAEPWLRNAYDCTPTGSGIVLTTPDQADMILRLAEPQPLLGAAYQVGTDDLLVVTHPQVAVGPLSADQVEALFAGQVQNWLELGGADVDVQVWTYAPTVDVQSYFEQTILHGRPITSLARLAVSAQDMSDSVGSSPGAVGLLPRHWKAGNTRDVLTVAALPVLALTDETPKGSLAELVACMQTKR